MIINAFIHKNNLNYVYFGKNNTHKSSSTKTSYKNSSSWALKTNVFAMHEAKKDIKENFRHASKEDYKILTDKSYDAASKRAKWFNPRDCKVYYIIKESQDVNGQINVRILTQSGRFVKNARIKPKTIVIADKFEPDECAIKDGSFEIQPIPRISHGEMVSRFAFVNNPFANYLHVKIDKDTQPFEVMKKVKKLSQEQKIDVVNFSWADLIPLEFYDDFKSKKTNNYGKIAQKIISKEFENDTEAAEIFCTINDSAMLIEDINTLTENGIKVFISAGNGGRENFNLNLLGKKVQGVGSLDKYGHLSVFNSSKLNSLVKHFELGEYRPTETKDGISYTKTGQTDYICDTKKIFNLRGKKASECLIDANEFKKALKAKKQSSIEFYEIFAKWVDEEKLLSGKQACELFLDKNTRQYDDLYVTVGDWIPYKINTEGKLMPYYLGICGTSFSSPIRAAKYALNETMKGIV